MIEQNDRWARSASSSLPERVSAEAALELIREGGELIDVRTVPYRDKEGIIEGARHIEKIDILDALRPFRNGEKLFVIFCSRDDASAAIVRVLRSAGIERVLDVAGGFHALAQAGARVSPLTR